MKSIFLLMVGRALCPSVLPDCGNASTSPSTPFQNSYEQPSSSRKYETFTGTVMKQGDFYKVLSDKANKTNYPVGRSEKK